MPVNQAIEPVVSEEAVIEEVPELSFEEQVASVKGGASLEDVLGVKPEESEESVEEIADGPSAETGESDAEKGLRKSLESRTKRTSDAVDRATQAEKENQELRERLAKLEGQMEKSKEPAEVEPQSLTEDQLLQLNTLQTEKLAEAKMLGDEEGVLKAKDQLVMIQKALREQYTASRAETEAKDQAAKAVMQNQQEFETSLDSTGIVSALKDEGSELHKATRAEFLSYRAYFEKFGEAGVVLAAASALVKNPALQPGGSPTKKLVQNLQKAGESAFQKPTGSSAATPRVNVNAMSDAEFDDLSRRLRSGQTTLRGEFGEK